MKTFLTLVGCGIFFFIIYIIVSMTPLARLIFFLCVLGIAAIYAVMKYFQGAAAYDRQNPR